MHPTYALVFSLWLDSMVPTISVHTHMNTVHVHIHMKCDKWEKHAIGKKELYSPSRKNIIMCFDIMERIRIEPRVLYPTRQESILETIMKPLRVDRKMEEVALIYKGLINMYTTI